MLAKGMHPLCCMTLESSGIRTGGSPEPVLLRTGSAVDLSSAGSNVVVTGRADGSAGTSVAGVLYKWTSYGKGWRSRWFTLRNNGVLSYSKTRRPDAPPRGDADLISCSTAGDHRRVRKNRKDVGIVHLKISSFRESRTDDRRFYIFTATKTLHLRTYSRKERADWIEALISTRSLFLSRPPSDCNPLLARNISISTDRLKQRLIEEGIGEGLVKDCEQIMLTEFSGIQGQYQVLCRERSTLLDTLKLLETENIEAATSGINDGAYRLIKRECANLAQGKYSEWSTTESPDDVEKQELGKASDEEDIHFFDTNEYFSEQTFGSGSIGGNHMNVCQVLENQDVDIKMSDGKKNITNSRYPHVERRKKLPEPIEKEKGVSLWSMIKDNAGKDLTRVCLPVYFNEPISSLQKCFEDLEYSHLLDQAYEHGKMGDSLMRILCIAAFAVSGYASSEGRNCKPFNPLLGETYEADYPDKGIRFFAEKVSHHPTLIACHCEGKGWKFWCDTNLKSKFWGRSIQLDPIGTLNLEFDDGELFQWGKVTTSINNLIFGTIHCEHHGTMHIQGNRLYSCKLKFKEQSILDRNPHQVNGFVEDDTGHKVAQLFGKWDDSMYFVYGEGSSHAKEKSDASLLWKRNRAAENLTRYNLSSFSITLNELTPGLKEKLPPTDSRLRPDQRYLENGEFDKANAEKLRLEMRQRMSRKLQDDGWKPRWFRRDDEGPFHYIGGYWEAREQGKWDGCPNIFGEISQDNANKSFKSS